MSSGPCFAMPGSVGRSGVPSLAGWVRLFVGLILMRGHWRAEMIGKVSGQTLSLQLTHRTTLLGPVPLPRFVTRLNESQNIVPSLTLPALANRAV